jgi:hypothetical protein
VKCGSSRWVDPLEGRQAFRGVAIQIRQLAREAARLRGVVRKIGHRRHLAINARLDAVEKAAYKAASLLVGTVEATRPPLPKASPAADPAPVSRVTDGVNLPVRRGNEAG